MKLMVEKASRKTVVRLLELSLIVPKDVPPTTPRATSSISRVTPGFMAGQTRSSHLEQGKCSVPNRFTRGDWSDKSRLSECSWLSCGREVWWAVGVDTCVTPSVIIHID